MGGSSRDFGGLLLVRPREPSSNRPLDWCSRVQRLRSEAPAAVFGRAGATRGAGAVVLSTPGA